MGDHRAEKQKRQKTIVYVLLALLFLTTLGMRLYFTYQTPFYSDEQAYHTLRQVEHIGENGKPIIDDPLSYSGRKQVLTPLFYYVLAGFNAFLPLLVVGKIIPNLFASSITLIVFFLAQELTQNNKASLFSAAISSFIPIYMIKTMNTLSPYTLAFPLFFLMLFYFMKITESTRVQYSTIFLICLVLLSLTHPLILVFLLSTLVYLALVKIEHIELTKREKELILLSLFFVIWAYLIIFKKAFFQYGLDIMFQNIPEQISSFYFRRTTLLQIVYLVGTIPLMYGVYAISQHLFMVKNKKISLLASVVFSTAVLLWLKLVTPGLGLIMLGVTFSILFALLYKRTFDYVAKTKFAKWEKVAFAGFMLIFVFSSVIPTLYYTSQTLATATSQEEIDAFMWIAENTYEESVVLTTPQEGHTLAYVSKRRNVADSNYLLINNINQVYEDVEKMYSAPFKTEAITLMNQYKVQYILFSNEAREYYDLSHFPHHDDTRCFQLMFENTRSKVYKLMCGLL
jgi:hypothetical protein